MNKYVTIFKSILNHELISGSFFLFVGAMIGNFLAFIFNLFLARTLSYADYGTYTSLLSLEILLIIPAGSLTAIIVRFATHYFAKGEIDKGAALYKKMTFIWIIIGIALFIIVYLLSPLLLEYLKIKNQVLVLIMALAVGISYLGVVNTAFIQSLTKFFYLSFISVVGNIMKLIVGLLLVVLGFNVVGALTGILALPLVMMVLATFPLLFLFKRPTTDIKIDYKEIVRYAIPVSIGIIGLSSFITTDVILVKHFFSPTLAGYYGGLSIVGKVIFYFTGFIPAVMFPLIVRKHTNEEKYTNTYLLSLFLVGLPSVAITVFYFLFPQLVIKLFLGGREYLSVSRYLWLYAVFITVFNLLNVTVNLFLSLKKTSVSYLVIIFAFLQIVLIYAFHNNFYQVIWSSIVSVSLLLVLLLLYFYFERHKK